MTSIIKLMREIKNTSFISHCKIAPGIKQLIEMIYTGVIEKPREFYDYHMVIVDFLLALMEKIDQENYLVDLYTSDVKAKSSPKTSSGMNEESDSVFLPYKITLNVLKAVNPTDRSGLLIKAFQIIKFCHFAYDENLVDIICLMKNIFQ
jgi:hypothetical protein